MKEGMEEGEKRTIAIVGASARAAAFSAVRAGYTPLTADLFADADLARVAEARRVDPYPRGLLDWLRSTPPDAPWMYTGALENHPHLVDEMAGVRPLVGCGGDVLRKVRDPIRLAKALVAADIGFPDTSSLQPTPIGNVANSTGWLLKSYRGSSGSGVSTWEGQSVPATSRDAMYLQRRIAGAHGSAVMIGWKERARLLGITRQLVGTPWANAGKFQYAGSVGPWRMHQAAVRQIRRAGQVVAKLGVVGLLGIDFVVSEDGRVWVLEVNPRYTASVEVVERVTGVAAVRMHVEARGAEAISRKAMHHKTVFGKAVLYAKQDLYVTARLAESWLATTRSRPWPALADLPHAHSRIRAGRPVLTVFAEGDSMDVVEARLRQDCETAERDLLRHNGITV